VGVVHLLSGKQGEATKVKTEAISLLIITISAKTASCFAEYFVYLQRISKMTRL
jgi:hypothetical protein